MVKYILFIISISPVLGQIDYIGAPEKISTEKDSVKVEWILSSPMTFKLTLDHKISFINEANVPQEYSNVIVQLYKNEEVMQTYLFKTGDGLINSLYTKTPINVRTGDHIFLMFTLIPTKEKESYVFNIFQDSNPNIKIPDSIVKEINDHKKKHIVTNYKPEISHLKKQNDDLDNDLKKMRRNRTMYAFLKIIAH